MATSTKYILFVSCACTAIIIGLFSFTYNDTGGTSTTLAIISPRKKSLNISSHGCQIKPMRVEARRLEQEHATKEGLACHFNAFKRHLRLNDTPPVVPVHLLSGCRHLVYNRVPKTGSRTTLNVQRNMAETHKFVHFNPLFITKSNMTSLKGMEMLKDKFEALHYHFIMTKHLHYVDFTPYLGHNPVYINVVREPTPWMVSWFNYRKYGASTKPRNDNLFSNDLQSCVRDDSCWNSYGRNLTCSNAIRFICGRDTACGKQSANALQMAKEHLRENYLVVGLTERLSEYFEVLEFLMPHMFGGSVDVYRKFDQHQRNRTKTGKKDPIDKESYQLLKSKLSLDYELYHYAVDRFDKLLIAVRYIKNTL